MVFGRKNEYQLNDSADYYFNDVERIATAEYAHGTPEQHMHARPPPRRALSSSTYPPSSPPTLYSSACTPSSPPTLWPSPLLS